MTRTSIDFDDRIPLYVQLAEIIRGQIERGEILARHAIPSKRALAEAHQVSLRTVDSAVALLKAEHLLEPELGRGLFVTEPSARGAHPRRRSTDR